MKMQRHLRAILSFFLFSFTSNVLADGPQLLHDDSPSTFAPTITGQPENVSVVAGGTATFSVSVSGALPINYYWSFDNTNLPGATNSTLTLTNVGPSQAGNYSVFIINDYGSTNSASATLSLVSLVPAQFFDDFKGPPLNLIWQTNLPDSAVCGSFLTGSFEIATNIGAPTYAFGLLDSNTVLNMQSAIGPQERVGWGSSTNFSPGNFRYEARFNTLVLSSTTSVDGFFEIWIMDTTNNNLYFMISTYEGDFDMLPYIFYGSSENNSYGANPYTFADNTWYRLVLESLPGQDIRASLCDDNERELFGANFGYDGTVFGSGFKIVIAQNVGSAGTNLPTAVAVDYVSLTPQFSPTFVDQPQNQTVPEGTDATLSTVVEGPPPLDYQWYYDGTSIAGATNSIMTITNIQPVNVGVYSLVVTNAFGSATSSNALLLTASTLAPTIISQPTNGLVVAGGTVTLSVSVVGASPLNYYWSFKNANIPGATNSTLTLTNVAVSQAGNYSVFAINNYGATNSASAALTVIANLPRLATTHSFGLMYISWPTNATGFVLVTTTNLLSGNWAPVATSPAPSGNQYLMPITPTGTNAFYRLERNGN